MGGFFYIRQQTLIGCVAKVVKWKKRLIALMHNFFFISPRIIASFKINRNQLLKVALDFKNLLNLNEIDIQKVWPQTRGGWAVPSSASKA